MSLRLLVSLDFIGPPSSNWSGCFFFSLQAKWLTLVILWRFFYARITLETLSHYKHHYTFVNRPHGYSILNAYKYLPTNFVHAAEKPKRQQCFLPIVKSSTGVHHWIRSQFAYCIIDLIFFPLWLKHFEGVTAPRLRDSLGFMLLALPNERIWHQETWNLHPL